MKGRAAELAAFAAVEVIGDQRQQAGEDSGADPLGLLAAETRLRALAEGVARGDRAAGTEAHALLHELADVLRARHEGVSGEGRPALAPEDRAARLEGVLGVSPTARGASGNKGKRDATAERLRRAAVLACACIEQRQQWPDGVPYRKSRYAIDPDSSQMHTDVARRVEQRAGRAENSMSGSSVRKWYGEWKRSGSPGLPVTGWDVKGARAWGGWWDELLVPQAEAAAELEWEDWRLQGDEPAGMS